MKKNVPLWDRYATWQDAERAWDEKAKEAAVDHPVKKISKMPNIPGITEKTAQFLKWKSLWWMITKDEEWRVFRYILKKPVVHLKRFISSLLKKKSFVRDGDFYFYGLSSEADFKERLAKASTVLVVGFSYCEKPFECPSGRFTSECIRDPEHAVCKQCFIGKAMNTLPQERSIPLVIPTIHYISHKIFEILEQHPTQEVVFLITACEMTLEMFGDWGNMAGVSGIGVRLDGRICNTLEAFRKSERGIKPGLTCTLPATKQRILDLLYFWRKQSH